MQMHKGARTSERLRARHALLLKLQYKSKLLFSPSTPQQVHHYPTTVTARPHTEARRALPPQPCRSRAPSPRSR
ncbi:unnamed protein product [Chondrus crispus]|uniref:Uncharacterized protein n=1 Tax=Chondrus crispus TaxID=2769 RepID=R7QKN6_CHOCR|nr:unnamed protein product [Chondrus crispus]CDF38026.1 unnamed protein product [Chondrus crispus]|eukprot:XP_005717895.1 unnamed protein product [Chondrus crispus]